MEKKIIKFLHVYKNALLLALVFGVLVSICLYFFVPKEITQSKLGTSEKQNQVDLVLRAFGGAGSVFCTLSGEELEGKVYIKNGNVLLEESGDVQYGNILLSENMAYVWISGETKGMKLDLQKNSLVKNFINEKEIEKQISKNNPECKEEIIDDAVFAVPQGIKFSEVKLGAQDIFNKGGDF